jgi:hypothetical protein
VENKVMTRWALKIRKDLGDSEFFDLAPEMYVVQYS